MKFLRLAYAILLIAVSSLSALAATDQKVSQPWQSSVQWDNDLLTGTDDGYTNGVRLAFTRALDSKGDNYDSLQRFLKLLTGANQNNVFETWLFSGNEIEQIQYGIGLSQLMFTPQDPSTQMAPTRERPYAGWLGLEFSLQASGGNSSNTATLSIGTTGRYAYAEDIQKWVHQNISDSPVFQGWDSQAPSEVTINLHFDHKHRLTFLDRSHNWRLQFDGFYEWGAALGNFRTDAYLGALIRFGHNLPTSYTTPRVQLGSFTDTIFNGDQTENDDFSLYGFAGARGYAVLHDITLDGPLFRHWDQSVKSEPWVGELTFGVALRWHWAEISLSHTVRSDEFEHQRYHSRYGSVLVRLSNDF